MSEDITFSKKEILKQFTLEKFILELLTRSEKYLKNCFEAFIESYILIRT